MFTAGGARSVRVVPGLLARRPPAPHAGLDAAPPGVPGRLRPPVPAALSEYSTSRVRIIICRSLDGHTITLCTSFEVRRHLVVVRACDGKRSRVRICGQGVFGHASVDVPWRPRRRRNR